MLRFICFTITFFLFFNSARSQKNDVTTNVIVEDSRIGSVQGVGISESGSIFIGDLLNVKVHEYTKEGDYIGSFGRRGQGPGEFQRIGGLQVGPKDSIYVYDFSARRLTVYPPDSNDYARTLSLSSGTEKMSPNVTGSLVTGITGLWLTSEGRPLIAYNRSINPMKETNPSGPLEIRFGAASSEENPVLRVRDRQMLVLKSETGNRRGTATLSVMPFGRKPIVDVGAGDALYFGQNDRLVVKKKEIGGSTSTVVSKDLSRVEISQELLRERLKKRGGSVLLDNFDRVWDKAPSLIPAFEDFVVDEDGRIWVAVNTEETLKKGQTEYWIFQRNGDLLRKVSLDRIVYLKAFDDEYAYGIATKPNGLQQIARAPLDALLP